MSGSWAPGTSSPPNLTKPAAKGRSIRAATPDRVQQPFAASRWAVGMRWLFSQRARSANDVPRLPAVHLCQERAGAPIGHVLPVLALAVAEHDVSVAGQPIGDAPFTDFAPRIADAIGFKRG
jgi:hypothetical protein